MHSWKWKSCSGRVKVSPAYCGLQTLIFWPSFVLNLCLVCWVSLLLEPVWQIVLRAVVHLCSDICYVQYVSLCAEVSLFELLNLFDRYLTYAQYACLWKFLCFASWFLLFIYIYLNVGCYMYLQLSSRIPTWCFGHYSNHMTKNYYRSLLTFFFLKFHCLFCLSSLPITRWNKILCYSRSA